MKPPTGSLLDIADRLCKWLRPLAFGFPVACVYNPLEYARPMYAEYTSRFGDGRGCSRVRGRALLLGMNPGPWGMAQTGVPFGEVNMVRDFLGLTAPISKPPQEHPKRPILGLSCPRSEVSGARLWSWARDTFGTADAFFSHFFVANYCPLAFMESSGANRTPDKLTAIERESLFRYCDKALHETVERLAPSVVIGVGNFAANRAREVFRGTSIPVDSILHPSPASPAANRNWAAQASQKLEQILNTSFKSRGMQV